MSRAKATGSTPSARLTFMASTDSSPSGSLGSAVIPMMSGRCIRTSCRGKPRRIGSGVGSYSPATRNRRGVGSRGDRSRAGPHRQPTICWSSQQLPGHQDGRDVGWRGRLPTRPSSPPRSGKRTAMNRRRGPSVRRARSIHVMGFEASRGCWIATVTVDARPDSDPTVSAEGGTMMRARGRLGPGDEKRAEIVLAVRTHLRVRVADCEEGRRRPGIAEMGRRVPAEQASTAPLRRAGSTAAPACCAPSKLASWARMFTISP